MKLLIIGTADSHIITATKMAKDRGAQVTLAQTIEAALDHLRNAKGADVVFINVKDDVGRFVHQLQLERINTPVIAYGIDATSHEAVAAIKAGAKEYIPLPPNEDMIAAVLQAISDEQHSFLYQAPAMKKQVELADRIAPSDANVLITGESGTGKEVIARYIHQKSKRAKAAFVSVNCAAIPEQLLESELFGHEKGAFTGALQRRIGKFEEANHGTLLLDEISEMDLRLQAKLLRAIQEQVIDRVGGTAPVKLNLRILATTNRNLADEVKKGTFREDLMFRLNVITLTLPPLRERAEDVALCANYFIEKYAKANGINIPKLPAEVLAAMQQYNWPGNVRELENCMHRAVLLANDGVIAKEHLLLPELPGASVAKASEPLPADVAGLDGLVGRTVEDVERELITRTLTHCLGNRTHAATVLGISIRTLRNKLNAYNIASDGDEDESTSAAAGD